MVLNLIIQYLKNRTFKKQVRDLPFWEDEVPFPIPSCYIQLRPLDMIHKTNVKLEGWEKPDQMGTSGPKEQLDDTFLGIACLLVFKDFVSSIPKRRAMKMDIWKCQWMRQSKQKIIWKVICVLIFIAALFTTTKIWKECKCPLMYGWMKKCMLFILNLSGYYLTIKKNESLPFATKWIDFKSTTLNKSDRET